MEWWKALDSDRTEKWSWRPSIVVHFFCSVQERGSLLEDLQGEIAINFSDWLVTLIKYVYHHEIPLSNYFSPWDLKFPFFNLPFNIWRVLSQLSPPQSSLPQLNKWFFLQYFLIGSQYNPVIIGFVPGRPGFILPGHAVQWLTLGYSTSYQFISQGSCDRDKIRWSQANYCTLSVQRMQRYKCSGVNK